MDSNAALSASHATNLTLMSTRNPFLPIPPPKYAYTLQYLTFHKKKAGTGSTDRTGRHSTDAHASRS